MIYIWLETTRLNNDDGSVSTWLYAMNVECEQHGLLESYDYDRVIYWEELDELVDGHLHSLHFA